MDNVSRPLIALLVGTAAFFALWIVALKPSSSGSGNAPRSEYLSAIAKAKQAVGTSSAASVAHGGTVVAGTPPGGQPTPSTPTRARTVAPDSSGSTRQSTTATVAGKSTTVSAGSAEKSPATAQQRLDIVTRALIAHHVVALLFYNPVGTDDQAVKHELATVPAHGRQVVKLAVPLNELARYPVVTNQLQVNESPTLVLIDGHGQASMITGFADRFEIAQRVRDALAAG